MLCCVVYRDDDPPVLCCVVCRDDELRCADARCMDAQKFCNGINDCEDFSDETASGAGQCGRTCLGVGGLGLERSVCMGWGVFTMA